MFEFEIVCKGTTKSEEFAATLLFFNYSFTFPSSA